MEVNPLNNPTPEKGPPVMGVNNELFVFKRDATTGIQYLPFTHSFVPVEEAASRWSTLADAPTGMMSLPWNPQAMQSILKNIAEHEKVAEKGVKEFFGKYKDRTFYIVGSGRSLVHQEDEIRRIPDEGVVVAINAGMQFFIEHDMQEKVDFFFIIDRLVSRNVWKGARRDLPCIASLMANPEINEDFDNRYYFIGHKTQNDKHGVYDRWHHLGILENCRLATYSAMHFAYRCGAKRIVLLGQDFCVLDGWMHWNRRLTWAEAAQDAFRPVETLRGEVGLINQMLMENRNAIFAAAILCEMDGVEVYNCSENGTLALSMLEPHWNQMVNRERSLKLEDVNKIVAYKDATEKMLQERREETGHSTEKIIHDALRNQRACQELRKEPGENRMLAYASRNSISGNNGNGEV